MCSAAEDAERPEGGLQPVADPERAPARRGDDPGAELSRNEASPLAREFAGAYRRMVDCLRTVYEKDNETALAEAADYPEHMLAEALDGDSAKLSWHDLDGLAHKDPALALRRWNDVKHAAIQDLASGHRAARALEAFNEASPFERAEFLALRTALAEEWQPRGGMEWLLIDKLAQASTEEMRWLKQAVSRRVCQWEESGRKAREEGRHISPRLSYVAATDQAMAMADRWNRIFCRTLRDLRRFDVHVNINGPGQVNIRS